MATTANTPEAEPKDPKNADEEVGEMRGGHDGAATPVLRGQKQNVIQEHLHGQKQGEKKDNLTRLQAENAQLQHELAALKAAREGGHEKEAAQETPAHVQKETRGKIGRSLWGQMAGKTVDVTKGSVNVLSWAFLPARLTYEFGRKL